MPAIATAAAPKSSSITLADGRVIPSRELRVRTSRSSGPGGQHVNKTSSRVELRWNLAASAVVTDNERAILSSALAKRFDADGWVVVVASDTRSQLRNRVLAAARLAALIERALTPRARRVRTTLSRTQKAKRLDAKRRHSDRKAARRTREFD